MRTWLDLFTGADWAKVSQGFIELEILGES
jgi:hypothetical protein